MNTPADVGHSAARHARWHWSEIAFWILALACAFLFPSRFLIMTDIVRLGLFALSLDLILGYAGIVSLGHAAFFGVGAYSAGLLALHGIVNEPVAALIVAGLVATVIGFFTSFLVIRGVDLTRLMVTLGIALLLEALAERYSNIGFLYFRPMKPTRSVLATGALSGDEHDAARNRGAPVLCVFRGDGKSLKKNDTKGQPYWYPTLVLPTDMATQLFNTTP